MQAKLSDEAPSSYRHSSVVSKTGSESGLDRLLSMPLGGQVAGRARPAAPARDHAAGAVQLRLQLLERARDRVQRKRAEVQPT
jgi:hypothetical protein